MISTFGRWTIEYDPVATRECYALAPVEHYCLCDNCRNFGQALSRAFPPNFLTIFEDLGIDARKPAELSHYGLEKSGLYLTWGWFHIVGRICDVEDAQNLEESTLWPGFVRSDNGLEFALSEKYDLAPSSFDGHEIFQLDFVTRVPWLIAAPKPEWP